MLEIINSNSHYRESLFPHPHPHPHAHPGMDIDRAVRSRGGKYIAAREVCIELLKDTRWMKDAERRGLVVRSEEGLVNGNGNEKWTGRPRIEWEATDRWNSQISNPVTSRLDT